MWNWNSFSVWSILHIYQLNDYCSAWVGPKLNTKCEIKYDFVCFIVHAIQNKIGLSTGEQYLMLMLLEYDL